MQRRPSLFFQAKHTDTVNKNFRYVLLTFQIVSCALFYFLRAKGDNPEAHYARDPKNSTGGQYASFQDVHCMIFIGFGFLMTYLKGYNWSSVGFTYMIGSVVIQWSIIIDALLIGNTEITIGFPQLFGAEFCAGAILISFGACLGKINHLQLLVMAIFEVVFYKVNEYVLVDKMAHWFSHGNTHYVLHDIGGSMVIHAFGAYFGLGVAKAIYSKDHKESPNEGSTYFTDLFAMIGSIFLWMFWPSFNSIPATDDYEKSVTITNTYLSLAASCVVTFAMSGFNDRFGRLNMVHIQNATLAGGVAMGSCANMLIGPYRAVFIGSLAGLVSTLGYQYIQPMMLSAKGFVGLHDTCGVHNLHGMPGFLAMIFSLIFGATLNAGGNIVGFSAAYQAAAFFFTFFLAISSGYVVGWILDVIPGGKSDSAEIFEDAEHWQKHE